MWKIVDGRKVIDPHSVEKLWEEMKVGRVQNTITPDEKGAVNAPPSTPYLTVVMISDTHCELDKMIEQNLIPYGDVLIHAGDITSYGDAENLTKFNEELGKLPHPHKIVIAGNHELGFDPNEDQSLRWDVKDIGKGTPEGWKLLTNCTFLNDSSTVIDGVTFYGSSWHPLSGFPFYQPRDQLKQKWEGIPNNTDVLITHSPPIGHLDLFPTVERWGCRYLLEKVEAVRPALHVFGHTHPCYGSVRNEQTIFVNAASQKVSLDGLKAIGFNRPLIAYIPKKI
ncbi:hypothetical protein PENTCL1PPCAC_10034 [Pristionchus entomophagus]|uniref:Calcineurin-like phosphoesterase domain-containing protein n=1 Tax=Pristionchus entomophagus TaxID=358040 RepID=A0AAV5SY69_9BILA|nr:hypothetical protein PENTCL1PPCAC_10034 [Pristionchus entomophagus]